MKTFLVAVAAIFFASSIFAGKPADERSSHKPAQGTRATERLVFVTGSLIPQRVQLRRVGTTTVSAVRIIGREEIDNGGRFTTPGAFVNEPAVRVIGH